MQKQTARLRALKNAAGSTLPCHSIGMPSIEERAKLQKPVATHTAYKRGFSMSDATPVLRARATNDADSH